MAVQITVKHAKLIRFGIKRFCISPILIHVECNLRFFLLEFIDEGLRFSGVELGVLLNLFPSSVLPLLPTQYLQTKTT